MAHSHRQAIWRKQRRWHNSSVFFFLLFGNDEDEWLFDRRTKPPDHRKVSSDNGNDRQIILPFNDDDGDKYLVFYVGDMACF